MSGKKNKNSGISIQNVTVGKKGTNNINNIKIGTIIAISVFCVIVLAIVLAFISESLSKNYYVKDIKILEGTVVQSTRDGGSNYIKLNSRIGDINLSEDNSWVEVTEEFYLSNCIIGDTIGVELSNVDVYKEKYFGLFGNKGQKLKKNIWYIENVYNSLEDANKANPTSRITKEATVIKKKLTKKGDYFLVINYEDKTMPVMVDENTYNTKEYNDTISCEFESIGDFTKFVKIVPYE